MAFAYVEIASVLNALAASVAVSCLPLPFCLTSARDENLPPMSLVADD